MCSYCATLGLDYRFDVVQGVNCQFEYSTAYVSLICSVLTYGHTLIFTHHAIKV